MFKRILASSTDKLSTKFTRAGTTIAVIALLASVLPFSTPQNVHAAATGTVKTSGDGFYTAWAGDEGLVDESGDPTCSSDDSVISTGADTRESFTLNLSSVPNGATITSVGISVVDVRHTFNAPSGTYRTFVRLNNTDINATADLTANDSPGNSSNCSDVKTQNIDVADVVKSGGTDLEVGVWKTATNNNAVRVGAISASINYNLPITTNPELSETCGLDIALVMDTSESINYDGVDGIGMTKTAYTQFVDAFLPETPTMFSVTEFNVTATPLLGMSGDQTAINSAIDDAEIGGWTNWQDGLTVGANSLSGGRADKPDLIIFASDGNPNRYGNPPSAEPPLDQIYFYQPALDAAIETANDIKAGGTRIITLGVGATVTEDNLLAISSGDAYYSAANFNELAATLKDIASDLCGGTVTVTKMIDHDNNDQTPPIAGGAGWDFTVSNGITNENGTTDVNGQTSAIEVDQGTFEIAEDLDDDYELVDATCSITNPDGTQTVGVLDDNAVTGVTIGSLDIVSCTFVNAPKPGKLIVKKQVVNDEPEGFKGDKSADDFDITVTINGVPTVIEGNETGVEIAIPAGASFSVTEESQFGYSPNVSDADCSGTMSPNGNLTCTVINNDPDSETGSLTIYKIVQNDNGGTAQVSDFTPTLTDELQNTTNQTFGTPISLQPGTYQVGEVGGPSGYASSFLVDQNTVTNCTSTGMVSISAGESQVCYITNDDIGATLTVNKVVTGAGAPDAASSFDLWITPEVGVAIATTSANTQPLNPGTYTVSETAKPNYSAAYSGDCNSDGVVTLTLNQHKTCTITNIYTAPNDSGTLIVNKVVVGSDEPTTSFAFQVNGGNAITFEADGSNSLNLLAGTYTVTESANANYTTTYDNCTGINLVVNGTQTCTITNTKIEDTNPRTDKVSGKVYNDNNPENGTDDPAEEGLSGWTVYIDTNNNNALDDGERRTESDSNGNYEIDELTQGCYTVREVLKADWEQTEPVLIDDFEYTVSIGGADCSSDDGKINLNFGNVQNDDGDDDNGGGGGGGGGGRHDDDDGEIKGDFTGLKYQAPPIVGTIAGANTKLPVTGAAQGKAWVLFLLLGLAAIFLSVDARKKAE